MTFSLYELYSSFPLGCIFFARGLKSEGHSGDGTGKECWVGYIFNLSKAALGKQQGGKKETQGHDIWLEEGENKTVRV